MHCGLRPASRMQGDATAAPPCGEAHAGLSVHERVGRDAPRPTRSCTERPAWASPHGGAAVASPCIREAGRRPQCMANTYVSDTAIELKRTNPEAAPSPDTYRPSRDPDALADLFTPDIILPEQFFDGARRDSYISGEKALFFFQAEDGI